MDLSKNPKLKKAWKSSLGIGTQKDKFARFTHEYDQLKDPATGQIPPYAREMDLMFAKTLRTNSKAKSAAEEDWKLRGPHNIGGRTRALAIDVADENVLLAGSVSGGLWKSIDGGANWTKVSNGEQNLSVTTITQDPRPGHTNEWYYGTGELFGASQSGAGAFYVGNGVYKSIDNGDTWEPLLETSTPNYTQFSSTWQGVWRIAIDPSNQDETEVYVATISAIYKSVDGGTSFDKVLSSPLSGQISYFTDVEIDANGVVYAGLSRENEIVSFGLSPVGGIWRSEDGDDWVNILPEDFSPSYNRIVMDVNPMDNNEVYFLISDVEEGFGEVGSTTISDPQYNALWRYNYLNGDGSEDGGEWTDLSDNIFTGDGDFDDFYSQSGYDLMVSVKPDEPNVVFIGGTNLYRSTDGFTTKDNISYVGGYKFGTYIPYIEVYPNQHPDQHDLIFLPSNPDIAFSASDGGLAKTMDCMAEPLVWESLNNGYVSTQFYTLAIEENDTSNYILGGLQDNGMVYANSEIADSSWTFPFWGDGSYCALPDDRDYMIISIQLGRVLKLTTDVNGEMIGFERIDPALDRDEFQFINALTLEPTDNNILYMPSKTALWVNQDIDAFEITNAWDSTMVGWMMHPDTLIEEDLEFTAISATKQDGNRVYLGTNDKKLFRIDNALDSESPLLDITAAIFPFGSIASIAVDPHDEDHVVVAFSNYGVYSLFASFDAGETWDRFAGNLETGIGGTGIGPSLRSISILSNGVDSIEYYLGTSIGLYKTDTMGGHYQTVWEPVAPELIQNSIVTVVKTRSLDNYIVAATHGNGVFSGNTPQDIILPMDTMDIDTMDIDTMPDDTLISTALNEIEKVEILNLKAYPNPASKKINIAFTLMENNLPIKLVFYDIWGRKLKTIESSTLQIGENKILVDISDFNAGNYYYSIESKHFMQTKMMVVN